MFLLTETVSEGVDEAHLHQESQEEFLFDGPH